MVPCSFEVKMLLNPITYLLFSARMLVRLLETSRDPLVLAVAAHDVGEYVRYYPRGKQWVSVCLFSGCFGICWGELLGLLGELLGLLGELLGLGSCQCLLLVQSSMC